MLHLVKALLAFALLAIGLIALRIIAPRRLDELADTIEDICNR